MSTKTFFLMKPKKIPTFRQDYYCAHCGEMYPLVGNLSNVLSVCCNASLLTYSPFEKEEHNDYQSSGGYDIWTEAGSEEQRNRTRRAVLMVRLTAFTIPLSIVLIAAWLIWGR